MLSITKCKKILNKNGIHYTDAEINTIREVLYKLAAIEYSYYSRSKESIATVLHQRKCCLKSADIDTKFI